jgi:predicted ATPase
MFVYSLSGVIRVYRTLALILSRRERELMKDAVCVTFATGYMSKRHAIVIVVMMSVC